MFLTLSKIDFKRALIGASLLVAFVALSISFQLPSRASALSLDNAAYVNCGVATDNAHCPKLTQTTTSNSCGGPGQTISTSIDFGCEHKGPALLDLTFAIIHFLSDGVGLVVVASLIWAGIQYTTSAGDPQATATAVKRIRSNVVSLFLYIFAYAILNYVVPGAILN
jgi:hypothetical protein